MAEAAVSYATDPVRVEDDVVRTSDGGNRASRSPDAARGARTP
jgi:hypothetical protein